MPLSEQMSDWRPKERKRMRHRDKEQLCMVDDKSTFREGNDIINYLFQQSITCTLDFVQLIRYTEIVAYIIPVSFD